MLRLYYRRAMVHTFTNVCKSTPVNSRTYGTKNQTRSARNAQHILDVALRLFSQQGVSSTSWVRLQKQLALRAVQSTGILRQVGFVQ